ncbi:membrane-bound lytic murein transglycosylase MltF [Candidatus Parabeggiatoa sp. HSG14]|uniref:membrane-bound lytic murein transglycosylase MltF n=1 Tax=Candidatus Parabeggiatoa sp. HSG14 TaxID=3055593 RepID=UPI0025A8750B|nr:membrane-bound lytic murein transglycosylase MltF [Thiotrichales bacterium HSG14]
MKFLGTLFLGIISLFYSPQDTLVEQIKKSGELRVVTREALTTYYESVNSKRGLEYELAKRFADELNVKLRLDVTENISDILSQVANHEVHFAAAGLTVTDVHQSLIRFGPSYQEITQQIIYRRGSLRPSRDFTDFDANHRLNVIAESHQLDVLNVLKEKNPQLVWKELSERSSRELLYQVWKKKIEYTLINSNEIAQLRRFYPELEVGFKLPFKNYLAWAFPPPINDNSLYLVAIQFFSRLQRSGELKQLIERYYGHIDEAEKFDYVNMRVFLRRIGKRLPKYQKYFEKIATRHHLDWRLLAAMGYQESKWNPRAVSKTGVKGLMMLTQSTAREMGVQNRLDPFESIEGGAKYFIATKERISKNIQEPDRTWFALAAYNVGLGHLRDVRKITAQQGDNSERWVDVKKHFPKLTKKKWYKKTKYGYARGYETVHFVKNVRRFYDILVISNGKKKGINHFQLPISNDS